MKKKVHNPKSSMVHPGDTQSTGPVRVFSGNAYLDGARQRGWFVGHFLVQTDDLRATPLIEVKWSLYHAGDKKQLWGASLTATTLCILIRGNITIWFPMTECILTREGDYVIWPAGIPHRWTIAPEDAGRREWLPVTVRRGMPFLQATWIIDHGPCTALAQIRTHLDRLSSCHARHERNQQHMNDS